MKPAVVFGSIDAPFCDGRIVKLGCKQKIAGGRRGRLAPQRENGVFDGRRARHRTDRRVRGVDGGNVAERLGHERRHRQRETRDDPSIRADHLHAARTLALGPIRKPDDLELTTDGVFKKLQQFAALFFHQCQNKRSGDVVFPVPQHGQIGKSLPLADPEKMLFVVKRDLERQHIARTVVAEPQPRLIVAPSHAHGPRLVLKQVFRRFFSPAGPG